MGVNLGLSYYRKITDSKILRGQGAEVHIGA
jgi:hypothetical protein